MAETQLVRKKISPLGLRMAAATILDSTPLLEVVEGADLGTDEDGNLTWSAIRALKVLFSGAARATHDDIAKRRLERMSTFLNEY